MSGNVYDWTLSIFDEDEFPYPYNPDDGRENIRSSAARVVRGGSWNDSVNIARAVFRYNFHPAYRDGLYGFRLLCPPFSDESLK
jgi:formylglycine-generating enzyme required for sulfatase activity